MVEFALGYTAVLLILAGVIEWGYSFYIYNSLQASIRDAARYASTRPYDICNPLGTGSCNSGAQWTAAVKNMAVYGDPYADPSVSGAQVPGLTVANITVTTEAVGAVPLHVEVQVNGLVINSFFMQLTLDGKPKTRFPYIGRIYDPA